MRLRPRHSPRPVLLVALAALLTACPPRVKYPECKVDTDCADHGEVCLNGFCKQCRADSDCQPGQVCKDNACAPRPECTSNEQCQAGLKCVQERCVPECTEATAEQDCGAGRRCVAGRCATERRCTEDADCGEGSACVDNVCRAQGSVTPAAQNARLGCEVQPVYFAFDDAGLAPEARDSLSRSWDCLQRAPYRRLLLQGHTDERGTTEYNLALGARRADAVRKYLIGLGADARRLKSVSFGEERPAEQGQTDAAFSANRRVEPVAEEAP